MCELTPPPQATGSFEYTRRRLDEIEGEIRREIATLGGNAILEGILAMLTDLGDAATPSPPPPQQQQQQQQAEGEATRSSRDDHKKEALHVDELLEESGTPQIRLSTE